MRSTTPFICSLCLKIGVSCTIVDVDVDEFVLFNHFGESVSFVLETVLEEMGGWLGDVCL